MNTSYIAHAEVLIKATTDQVWEALTDPAQIKQYLFDTNVTSDWQVGSPIVYEGEWEGKKYQDKGKIVEMIPGKLLVTTYWSNMAGTSDSPENYLNIRYELQPNGDSTKLTITQDNNATQEAADHSTANWKMVLETMKKLLEK